MSKTFTDYLKETEEKTAGLKKLMTEMTSTSHMVICGLMKTKL